MTPVEKRTAKRDATWARGEIHEATGASPSRRSETATIPRVKKSAVLVAVPMGGLAVVMLVKRPWLDRVLILLAAVPVAILANVIRIVLTGVLYNEGGKELGDRLFHDFAGWLMMPLALLVLWLGLKVLDWVLVDDAGRASREEVLRASAANPALAYMQAGTTKPAPAKPAPGTPR